MNKKSYKIASTSFLIERPNQDEQKVSQSDLLRNQVWHDWYFDYPWICRETTHNRTHLNEHSWNSERKL